MRRLFPSRDVDHDVDLDDDLDDDELARSYEYPQSPWVRANMVAAADGAATLTGRSGGLSSPADKRLFALLRDLCDVVLVGAGTVRAEGYQAVKRSEARVDWRRSRGLPDVPPIAVVTGSLDLDPSSALFVGARERTIVITTERAAGERGAEFVQVADLIATPGDRVDLAAAIDALVGGGLRHILCEGGPRLLAQLVAAGRLDELCLTMSPLLVGGEAPRVLHGVTLEPPRALNVAELLIEADMLFARYLVTL